MLQCVAALSFPVALGDVCSGGLWGPVLFSFQSLFCSLGPFRGCCHQVCHFASRHLCGLLLPWLMAPSGSSHSPLGPEQSKALCEWRPGGTLDLLLDGDILPFGGAGHPRARAQDLQTPFLQDWCATLFSPEGPTLQGPGLGRQIWCGTLLATWRPGSHCCRPSLLPWSRLGGLSCSCRKGFQWGWCCVCL